MTELTDLEIRKFITLLGLKEKFPNAKSIEFDDTQNCFWVDTVGFTSWPLLNPLTDGALCFRFCYEDGITIKKSMSSVGGVMEWNGKYHARHRNYDTFGSVDENPNKAVCLEKIEAHKES